MNNVTIETVAQSSDKTLEHMVGRGLLGGAVEMATSRVGQAVVVVWTKILKSGRRSTQQATFRGADAEVNAKAFAATKWTDVVAWLEKL